MNYLHLLPYLKYWVGFGAISGGIISGIDKIWEIAEEPTPVYKNPKIEKPIQAVYHLTRVAGSSGFGTSISGLTALTAPVSIPAYIYYKYSTEKEIK